VALAHADDVALAAACAAGDEAAWERFVREYRPVLYRAADALDTTGRARELADALYADLFGLTEREGERRSLFRYYQGRSSLATWLRAVLAQRYVDLLRPHAVSTLCRTMSQRPRPRHPIWIERETRRASSARLPSR
jgi:DNA-directed RNA polymerase specialized sigma24 family protein